MRILIAVWLATVWLVAGLPAQDPKPAGTGEKPPVVKVEPPKGGTTGEKGQEAGGKTRGEGAGEQDPKQQKGEGTGKGKEQGQEQEQTEVDLPEDVPLPEGADYADLRAMKGAQEMVAAERRLRARIKSGQIKDIDKLLSFQEISSWPFEGGLKGMPKAVKELDGDKVVMIGFMLPIDEVEDIKEFLLVESLWACCYGQPPDINGLVRVVMKGDRRCDYQFDPILVKGTFKVEETLEDGYCVDVYQLHATEVSLLR